MRSQVSGGGHGMGRELMLRLPGESPLAAAWGDQGGLALPTLCLSFLFCEVGGAGVGKTTWQQGVPRPPSPSATAERQAGGPWGAGCTPLTRPAGAQGGAWLPLSLAESWGPQLPVCPA